MGKKSLTQHLISFLAVAFALLFAFWRDAAAQDHRLPNNGSNGDGLDTHLFRPAVDSKGFFSVNGSDILGAKNLSFGLVLDYGRNLMRTRSSRVPNGTITNDQQQMVEGKCEDETCVVNAGEGGTG